MASTEVIEKVQEDEKFFGQVRIKNDDNIDFHDPSSILVMKNIHKTYLLGIEGVPALRGVTMSIKRGEFVCIFGTSGGGKTTMLNIIGTIDKPTKGDMKLCGKMINHKTTDKDLAFLRLKHIGFVFQTFNLLSSLTALENVEMPMILLGELSASERRERAISLLTKVGMKDRLDHFPSQLSGGEQQRVTIARAIANKPEVLLLDEPTGDLDTVNTSVIMKLLTDLNKNENITLVMVTHDVGLKMYSDRIIWMRDGKIQRIEIVPKSKQQEQFQKLYREVDTITQNQKNGVTSVYVDSGSSGKKTGSITEYRRPFDYKSIAYENLSENSTNNINQQHQQSPRIQQEHQESILKQNISMSPTFNSGGTTAVTTTTTTTSSSYMKQQDIVNGKQPISPSLSSPKQPYNIDNENRFPIDHNSQGLLINLGDEGSSSSSPFTFNRHKTTSVGNLNDIISSDDIFLQSGENSPKTIEQITKDIERIL